jgi:hypothetical protein
MAGDTLKLCLAGSATSSGSRCDLGSNSPPSHSKTFMSCLRYRGSDYATQACLFRIV